MRLPVLPPVTPMLAKSVRSIPEGASYEPKWDGFRSICFRDGENVELGSRNERPLTRYFPELVAAAADELPGRCVIDGEIVIVTDSGLDFEALQQRIHPAASRVRMLAEQLPASFAAFDLLALDDEDFTAKPFSVRRAALAEALRGSGPRFRVTPATTDLPTALRWFEDLEGAGFDGVIAKPLTLPYLPGQRAMFKIKHERTADCVVAGFRLHKGHSAAVGSLLLGLYRDDGTLVPVGVIGAFPMAQRRTLFAELQALVATSGDHPWQDLPAEASRWSAGRDLSSTLLRPERVVEVRYDRMQGDRFRHIAQFSRWRPDRAAGSCTFAQIERHPGVRLPGPFSLAPGRENP